MKKMIIINILLTFLLAFSASASVEKFSDWIYDYDTLTLDDQTFEFKVSESISSVVVTHNDEPYIIPKNDCEDTKKLKICVIDTEYEGFDNDKRKAYVVISYFAPNITIARTSDFSEVDVGEKIKFDLDIENIGDFDAKNVKYTDSFPKEILLEQTTGDCVIGENNSIIFTGSLGRGEKLSCTYTVIPQNVLDVKLKGQVDYFDGFKEKKEYSDLVDLKANAIFEIKAYRTKRLYEDNVTNQTVYSYTDLEDIELEVGDEVFVYINLTNVVFEKIRFEKLKIIMPPELIVKKTYMDKEEDYYFWDGVLDVNESEEFFFIIIPTKGGVFDIKYDTKITKNKKELVSKNNKISIEVDDQEVLLTSNLDNKTEFDSGKEVFVSFWAENKYNYSDIEKAVVTVSSNLIRNVEIPVSLIEKNQKKLLYKASFIPNEVSSSTSHKFTVTFNYTTEFGEEKSEKEEWTLTLKPLSDLEIVKTLSDSSISENEEVTVTVTVKNIRARPVYDVTLREVFPPNINRRGLANAFFEKLDADEKVTAYEYVITAPKVKEDTKFSINTTLTYFEEIGDAEVSQEKQLNLTKALSITIKPKKIDLDVKKTSDKSKYYLGDIAKVFYTLENKDTETAYDVTFEFSESENVDVVNDYTYYFEQLEPGEVVSFQQENLRLKKEGDYNAGKTFVFFKDSDGNLFNYTIDSLKLDVEDKSFGGPVVFLEKVLDKTKAFEKELVNATIIVSNDGDGDALVTVVDGERLWKVNVGANRQKNITYQIKALRDLELKRAVYAYYNHGSNKYRAYADNKVFTVELLEEVIEELKPITTNNTLVNKDELVDEQPGFFSRVWNAIKKIFGIG